MKKPRLAIECIVNDKDENWEQGFTTYFNIDDTKGIVDFIKQNRKKSKIIRFYYANEYGIEVNWN